jgi:hypothetical protein
MYKKTLFVVWLVPSTREYQKIEKTDFFKGLTPKKQEAKLEALSKNIKEGRFDKVKDEIELRNIESGEKLDPGPEEFATIVSGITIALNIMKTMKGEFGF